MMKVMTEMVEEIVKRWCKSKSGDNEIQYM